MDCDIVLVGLNHRTAGVDVQVEDLTAEELKNYKLEGTEHHIPLLDEVLPIFAGKAPLIVELKAGKTGPCRVTTSSVKP